MLTATITSINLKSKFNKSSTGRKVTKPTGMKVYSITLTIPLKIPPG